MKYRIVLAIMVFASTVANAQIMSNNNLLPVVGEFPQSNPKYANLTSGTPFFQDEWVKAKIVSADGLVYKEVEIKLNLIEDRVHFLNEKGDELLLKETLSEIEFHPNSKGKKYYFLNGSRLPGAKKGWHQLLVNDSITLLKSFQKTVVEHKSYGSPIEYSIETVDNFHVVRNGQSFEIKRPIDMVLVLPSKASEIEAQVKKLNKKMSREEQMIAITTFMNMID